MSEFDFLDQFEGEKERDRSLFLSGLCVLTWIGCWIVMLYYGLRIVKINDIERSIYHFEEWQMEYYLMKISVIAPIFSAIGAILMWRLKKAGLFVYAFGQVAQSAFGLYVYLLVKEIDKPESYYFIAFFIIQLGFIPLYAMNWRSLK